MNALASFRPGICDVNRVSKRKCVATGVVSKDCLIAAFMKTLVAKFTIGGLSADRVAAPDAVSDECGGTRQRLKIAGVALALLVLALLTLSGCSGNQERKPMAPPIKVGAVSVDRGNIEQSLDVSGTLRFTANTTVSAEVSAQIQSIEVADGQPVSDGQLLLVFDESKIRETANQAQANLRKDEATLVLNHAEWEKHLGLLKSNSISQTVYDQKFAAYQNSLAQVEHDKAALAKATQDLTRTRVKAPVGGVLSNRYVEKGDWVFEGGKLFQIGDYRKIYLEAYVSDLEVGKLPIKKAVSEGVDAEVKVDSYPDKIFGGRLTYIQPVANESRLFQIRIYLDNPEMALLQGMFARGRIVVNVVPGVIRIPLGALLGQVRNNEDNSVFIVDEDNKAKLSRIRIGVTNHTYGQVLDGLKEGELVIADGKEVITTGQSLAPILRPKPEAAPLANVPTPL
jgi:RND family efflux transporter MFP subunit